MQDNTTQRIIARLKTFKQQGLTFYQASEELKRQGYTPVQIADAAGQFNYASPIVGVDDRMNATPLMPAPPRTGSEMDRSYQKLGNALLADKERSRRPYVYVGLVIPAGGFTQSLYRFWLNRKYWGSHGDSRYLLANNLQWVYVSGAIGAILMLVGLMFYFRVRDRRYERIDRDLR